MPEWADESEKEKEMHLKRVLDVGTAHEFWITWQRADGSLSDIARMTKNVALCRQLIEVIRGRADVVAKTHVIETNKCPQAPYGLVMKADVGIGPMEWGVDAVRLFRSSIVLTGGSVKDLIGRAHDARLTPLNATVLDFLLAHPEQVPALWRGKTVIFPATTYTVDDRICYRVFCPDHKEVGGYMFEDDIVSLDVCVAAVQKP